MHDCLANRTDFRAFRAITTRWVDNDSYGHVNNAVYYSYFDTAVNAYLIETSGVDIRKLPSIGIVAESSCRFFRSLSFPERVEAGLALEKLGNSSVVYRIGLFTTGVPEACAVGRFVHVYVDAVTRHVAPIPDVIRAAVGKLSEK